jgi:hypothetical protein
MGSDYKTFSKTIIDKITCHVIIYSYLMEVGAQVQIIWPEVMEMIK